MSVSPNINNNSFYDCGYSSGGSDGVIYTYRASTIIAHNNNIYTPSTNSATGITVLSLLGGSFVVDYNNVYGVSTLYDIPVSVGSNSISADPLFIDPDNRDLHLSQGSPCIGTGGSAQAPALDADGETRPVGPSYDIGAYEYIAMIVFVNAAGSDTSPYDTVATGATTLKNLLDNITQKDGMTVEVVDDGIIDDSADFPPNITKGLIFRSWSGNTNKPSIKGRNTGSSEDFIFKVANGVAVTGLIFRDLKLFTDGADARIRYILFDTSSNIEDLEVSGCEAWTVNPTNTWAIAIWIKGNISGSSSIENNLFYQLRYGIQKQDGGTIDGLVIEGNTISDIESNAGISFGGGSLNNVDIIKNTISRVGNDCLVLSGLDFSNVTIANNVLSDFDGYGLQVNINGDSDNLKIANNTISLQLEGKLSILSLLLSNGGNNFTDSIIVNNIVYSSLNIPPIGMKIGGLDSSCLVDYNNVYGYQNNYAFTSGDMVYQGDNRISEDPLFISSTDFKLSPASPCIDKGVGNGTISAVPTDDMDGVTRPVDIARITNADDGTDMGAYESITAFVGSYIEQGNTVDVSADEPTTINSVMDTTFVKEYSTVLGDSDFDNESKWSRAIVFYENANAQKVSFTHEIRSGGWTAFAEFLQTAISGNWEKTRIILIDKMGGRLFVERAEIGTDEDITIIGSESSESSSFSSVSSESSESSDSSASGGGVLSKFNYYFRMRARMTGTFIPAP